MLLPFDAFPLVPGGFLKQASIIPLMIYFFVYIRDIKFLRNQLYLSIIILFYTLVFFLVTSDFSQVLKVLYVLFLFNLTLAVFLDLKNSFNIRLFFKTLFKSSILYILIALYLIQVKYVGLSLSGLNKVLAFISDSNIDQSMGDRFYYINLEPAYAAAYLNVLYFSSFVNIDVNKKIIYLYRFVVIVLLFFTSSSYGYIIFIIVSLYQLFSKINIKTILLWLILGAAIYLIAINEFYLSVDNYTYSRVLKILEIFQNWEDFLIITSTDQSLFLRLVNPIIGLDIARGDFFMPLGLETSYYHYPKQMLNYSQYLPNDVSQIQPIIDKSINTTPNNLFVKVLIEFGIVGLIIVLNYWRRMFMVFFNNNKKLLPIFMCLTLITFQIDSYVYLAVLIPFLYLFYFSKVYSS